MTSKHNGHDYELLINSCVNFWQTYSERAVPRTHNIRLKEIKKEGLCEVNKELSF